MAESDVEYKSKPRCAKRPRVDESSLPVAKKRNTTTKRSTSRVLAENTNDLDNQVRCKLCRQIKVEKVNIFPNAQSECVVLTNDALANIFTDNDDQIQHNLTNYSIYDENGHLCSFDSGLMERDVSLYLTGYVKPAYDHDPSIENGFAATELGPILEWWISLYDGDSRVMIGVSTDYADYVLVEPNPNFSKYMTSVIEKSNLSNIVIKSLLDSDFDDSTYEDVLNYVVNSINPATNNTFTEEHLIVYAQFVLDQIVEYDTNFPDSFPLAETQCIKTLTELSGVTKPNKVPNRRAKNRTRCVETNINKREFSKATTTELVNDVFENMFAAQLDCNNKENDGSANQLKKTVFDDGCTTKIKKEPVKEDSVHHTNEVFWNDKKLCKNMFVVFKNGDSTLNLIGRIEYLFKTKSKNKAHVILFTHSYHTILGEAADDQEIFVLKKCTNIDLNDIGRIIDVKHKVPSDDWFNLGNSKLQDLLEPVNRDNKSDSFFFQLQYDDEFGRFEYPKLDSPCDGKSDNYCSVCEDEKLKKESEISKVSDFIEKSGKINYYYKFSFDNNHYKVGNFIYLPPDTFSKSVRTNMVDSKPFMQHELNKNDDNHVLKKVDESKYPEFYRKTLENSMRGSNKKTPDPFEIGEILAVYTVDDNKKMVKLVVRRMYRAEKIPLEGYGRNADMNMLFWSDEEFQVLYKDVRGKCFVAFTKNIKEDPFTWCSGGPDRFYFSQKYDFTTGSITSDQHLSRDAKLIGKEVYVDYDYNLVAENQVQNIPSYKKIKPLKGLDIFAGCGGLSKGLEDSGLVDCKWAIECDDMASTAFKLNNPKSTVFVEDCNNLLKSAISGNSTNSKNQRIPKKGEVEFICGGPPCQGFSGMNRFNSGQYSLFKNSLIVSFLSYIDYYRPKYFLMENVRNFVSFKQSMVLKLTLRCITRMGYQCTFGILQAGNFGVPQTRRRLIIMAAAPGEQLPLYPEPIHVFNKRSSSLNIQVGDKKYRTNCKYEESAPMRTVTVYDAWSDLPKILNGANEEKIPYQSKPMTHMQKMLRYPDNCSSESTLIDHICKDMSPLVQARMELIPVGEGSDWRDLPNAEVKLSDGTMTNKLVYNHQDLKNGKSPDGALRGVCPCASGQKCNPQDRQNNTIIPWCLPHTANRHNNWASLYGRLDWEGFCSTTITNPEPMGKQGRVLHPEQNRVVSVRECARSQGFKDSFVFHGPIINKHRQIGNAVPPPMGKAIGHEIIKAIHKKSQN